MSGIKTLSVDPLILQGLLRHIPQMLDQIEIWSMEAKSTPSVLYCALEPNHDSFCRVAGHILLLGETTAIGGCF